MDALQAELKKEEKREERSPVKVLFVCTGNTCRSPMAAALLNDMSRPREVCSGSACSAPQCYTAISAGLFAGEGEPISPDAVRVLEEAGIPSIPGNDFRAHRARNLTEKMMQEADMVFPISGSHAMQIFLRFPAYSSKVRQLPMDIPDPYGKGIDAYRQCLAQLRLALSMLSLNGEEETWK